MADDRARLLRTLALERAETDRSPPARRRWPRLTALGAVAMVALAGSLWFFVPQLLVGGRADQAIPVEVRPRQPAPALPSEPRQAGGLSASGYVVARRKATVAAEITGKVVEVFVDEGMVVPFGHVVARLDSALAETDLALAQSKAAAAEAAVAAIAAELRDAERIIGRVQRLKSFASEAELTKAEARVGVVRAQVSQAQAHLETARLDVQRSATMLDKHRIRAPFGGVVVERSAQPGEMISPMSAGGSFTRTGICTIVDMDSIEIEVDVNEAFIGRVRTGSAVSAVLDAYPEWTIPASVIAIVPTANREKATVKVRIAIQKNDPRILPDMAVKVKILDDSPSTGAASADAARAAS